MLTGCTQKTRKAALKKILLLLFCEIVFFLVFFSDTNAKSGSYEVPAKVAEGQTKRIQLYSGYYALIVGCGDYRKGWPPLPNPVKDAREVASTLKEMGWEVDLLEDPDAERLMDALTRLVAGPGQEKDKGVLFWFSGHGETLEEADGTKLGYIVPVDAPDPKRDETGFVRKAIDMRQLETIAKRIRSKHVLMAFDSCFSGAIFNMVRSSPSPYLLEKVSLPVREFITAGREDERVPDRSVFKTCFLQAIRDKLADRNGDGYVTGEELGAYLQEEVVNYTRKAQHPQFGKINNPKLDKGDFVFMTAQNTQAVDSKNEQGRHESEALRQQLDGVKKDLEAEKLRQEIEQTRKQLEQLKQIQSVDSKTVGSAPEPKSEPQGLKPAKERVEQPPDDKKELTASLPAPTESKKQEMEVLKRPEKATPSADEGKNAANNLLASLPPAKTESAKKQPPPEPDVIPQSTPSEKHSLHRLAVFPFSLNRGRDFSQYNNTDRFFEAINKVVYESGLFIPVYSVYDLKNPYGTKLITSDLIAKESLERIWSKSGSPELDMDLTIRLGKQLGVDVVLACKVRTEPWAPYTSSTFPDSRLEYLEVLLVDVSKRIKYSNNDDTNVASSLKNVIKEYTKDHPITLDKTNQAGTSDPVMQASLSPNRLETTQKQTGTPPDAVNAASPQVIQGASNRYKLAILPFYMNARKDFAAYGNEDLLLESIVSVINDTDLFTPVYSPYALGGKFTTKTLSSVSNQDFSLVWRRRASSPFPEPDVALMAQLGANLGVDAVLTCSFNITYGRANPRTTDSLNALRVVLIDVKGKKNYMQDDHPESTFGAGSSSKAKEAFTTSLRKTFENYKKEHKE
jgi:uncharacterized caspase-like protein